MKKACFYTGINKDKNFNMRVPSDQLKTKYFQKKTIYPFIILLLISHSLFSQKIITEKKDVRYIQLPLTAMPGVKTYNCVWDNDSIKINLPGIDTKWGFNDMMIKGCMSIQGLTYSETDPDITVTLQSSTFELADPKIVNLNEGQENANYRIVYKFPMDWKIRITGKFEKKIALNPSKVISVYIPSLKEQNMNPEIISNPDILNTNLKLNRGKIDNAAIREFLDIAENTIENTVQTELALKCKVKKVEISSFKTSKKVDMSTWDGPYKRGQELLTKISSGKSPIELYNEYKDIFNFWDEQLLSYKADERENKKYIKVTFNNLINTLELVNPAAIKDEYFEIYSNIDRYETNKVKKRIADAQKRQLANKDNTLDYSFLSQLIPLRYGNKYEISYTTDKGEKKLGIISFGSNGIYGLNPYQTGTGFNIYDKEICLERDGNVYNKYKVDLKKVASYELLGEKYIKLKFADPTSINLGLNEFFVQELISGKVSLYKHWQMEQGTGQIVGAGIENNSIEQLENSRTNPMYVIDLGKKKTVIYNYKKLAKFLEDCQPVVDKINSGAYGNTPLNGESSKLGNALQTVFGSRFDENILINIINDYNAAMQ